MNCSNTCNKYQSDFIYYHLGFYFIDPKNNTCARMRPNMFPFVKNFPSYKPGEVWIKPRLRNCPVDLRACK